MRKIRKWDWTSICIILACLAVLFPIYIISMYNRPVADDYDYAIQTYNAVKNGGGLFAVIKAAVETSKSFYNVWQGLYTSAFVLAMQPGIYGETYYCYSTLIIVTVCYLQILASGLILNKYVMKKNFCRVAAISAMIMTFFVLWMPSPAEGLFWYNGAMNYLPWIFADVLNLCLLYDVYKTESKKRKLVMIAFSTVFSFVISGANHVTAFANILLLLAAIVVMLPKKKCFAIIPFVSACIGFIIMYKAPGTAIRQQAFTVQTVPNTIFETLKYVRMRVGDWVSIEWLLLLVMLTPYVIQAAKQINGKIKLIHIAFFGVVSFGVICGMCCVPFYAMGGFGAGRVTNVIWGMFIFASIFLYFLFWVWLLSNKCLSIDTSGMQDIKKRITVLLLVVVCLCGLTVLPSAGGMSSSYTAFVELYLGIPQKYCAMMEERIELYNDPSLTEVAVKPIEKKPSLFFMIDVGTDPEVWPNTSISNYYGKSIYLDTD